MIKSTAASPFHEQSHDHEVCVDNAMAQAEELCRQQGLRLTSKRRRVLEIVWRSHRPVGAYDILDELSAEGKRSAPPTVYRALDFLIDAGLVHRLDTLNAFIGCADPKHAHAGQFLICSECRSVAELDDPEIESMVSAKARAVAFEARSLVLEIRGRCDSCRSSSG